MDVRALLLDTHVLVWLTLGVQRLSARARETMENAEALLVSAASLYEIDVKRRRLYAADAELRALPDDLLRALPARGLELLSISPEVAWRAANLEMKHQDPWDRILVAQAASLGVPLVTCDGDIHRQATGVTLVW